ncbi:helix-turn-helix domain-containing protein [Streptomyces sp. CA-181903]|uniref:helix-turn-helix domain-containing protein n=1 Tax=Streptomyces sp. CA-181903 TaxID=3240055 RepID=UPI003D8F1796
MYDPVKARARRIKLGLTVPQLADRMGVDSARVYRWENGERLPSLTSFVGLAHALRIPFESLLRYADDESRPALITAEIRRAELPGERETIRFRRDAAIEIVTDRVRARTTNNH